MRRPIDPEIAKRFRPGDRVRIKSERRRTTESHVLTLRRANYVYACSGLGCQNRILIDSLQASGLGHYCLDCCEPIDDATL